MNVNDKRCPYRGADDIETQGGIASEVMLVS